MYRVYLQTEVSGEKKTVQVFPRSKKTANFKTIDAAVKKLESLHVIGRGLIFDASKSTNDWNTAYTIAL